MITDHQRFEFMQKLAAAARAANGLLLEDWENRFLTSWLQSSRPTLWFIGERPKYTDRLWMKYGFEIGLPFPLAKSPSTKLADADADACEYLVRDENRQMARCNAPAAFVNRNNFRYCADHAEQVQKDLRRRGGHMELRRFTP